ncbi:hypothetical protein QT970_21340 [Microcoleus sp. herbarium8]
MGIGHWALGGAKRRDWALGIFPAREVEGWAVAKQGIPHHA